MICPRRKSAYQAQCNEQNAAVKEQKETKKKYIEEGREGSK